MRRRLFASVLILLMATPFVTRAHAGGAPTAHRYDQIFRKYSKRFFGPGFDWRLFKAQGLVESRLSDSARSRAGAIGVMQLRPKTYAAIRLENPEFGDIGDPQWNIAAGISYARDLWKLWQDDVDSAHQSAFMLGSYNAGRSTLLRAQRMAEAMRLNHRQWPSIEFVGPTVPGWRYQETVNYVLRVFGYVGLMDPKGRLPATY